MLPQVNAIFNVIYNPYEWIDKMVKNPRHILGSSMGIQMICYAVNAKNIKYTAKRLGLMHKQDAEDIDNLIWECLRISIFCNDDISGGLEILKKIQIKKLTHDQIQRCLINFWLKGGSKEINKFHELIQKVSADYSPEKLWTIKTNKQCDYWWMTPLIACHEREHYPRVKCILENLLKYNTSSLINSVCMGYLGDAEDAKIDLDKLMHTLFIS